MLDKHAAVLVLPLLVATGCVEDITVVPGPGQLTMAVFDLTTNPPSVPFPTDLIMDPVTGLLDIPPADPTQEPAQAYLDGYLNTLNGWPGIIPGEVHFTGALDKATVNERNIVVLELDPTDPTKVTPVTGAQYDYATETGGGSVVKIYPPGMSWNRGSRYVVLVIGGSKGLKAAGNKQVYRMPYFELAAAADPLCVWDKTKSWDSATMSCATPSGGAPAVGCCTFNYNGVIASATKDEVRHDPKNADLSLEEVEALAAKTVLERVTRFELMRQSFNQVLDMAAKMKIPRDDVAVLWSFKILDMNEAVFDPTVTPPRAPIPSDLVKDPQTGLLALPIDPSSSKAEQTFTAYLNTLDGWPMSFPGQVEFTDALDPASTAKGALVFSLDMKSTPPKATKVDNVVVTYDEKTNKLNVTRKGGQLHATTHVMVALGGTSGLKNKDTSAGAAPIRSPFMHLALSPHPLCDSYDAASRSCGGDPTVNVFTDDPSFVTNGMTAKQKAAMFEAVRLAYDGMMKAILAADSSLKSDDVKSLWAFTTTSRTMVNIDPQNAQIPYPSDLIYDSTAGKVALPASPNETPAEKAMREAMNTMDGMPTQATYFVPVAGKIDPASVALQNAALTLNVSGMIPAPTPMTVTADNTAGALTFKPVTPLAEKNQYAVILTSKAKAGGTASEGGLKDDKGNVVVPSPATVLLRLADPVYDETTQKSLVSVLDDATAAQLEAARKEAAPYFGSLGLLGIQRDDVVGMWTMTTMGSITSEMMQLRALPYKALAAADQNKPKLVGALDKALTTWPTTYMNTPKTGVGGIVASGTYKSYWAIDPTTGTFTPDTLTTKGKVVDVPFLLTVPSTAAPPTGYPLVLYVQSVYQSKAEALSIASANAQKGMATITFDLPYHGERSWCVKDEECDANGTCDATTGTCSTKLADKDNNGIVDASGNDMFVNLQNPFAIRDNLRQAVIDASALLRAVQLGGASGITGGPVAFDPAKVTIAGYSTGALVATDWLAVEGNVTRAALNSPPIRFAEIFFGPDAGKDWDSIKQATFQAQGIKEGTLDALQLVTTFQWIMEPADPGNFGRHISKVPLDDLLKPGTKVPAKQVIAQQAEKDEGVPVRFSDDLLTAIGITDTTKTFYLGQAHRMFKLGDPDLTATQACRTQMSTFLSAGTVCTPAVSGGKYTGQCN